MTGARITFEFQHQAFTDALARLDLSQPGRRQMLMRSVASGLLHTTRDRFATSRDPQGRPWAPLNPAYAASRKPDRILMQQGDSGGLLGTLVSKAEGNTVTVSSNKVYAAIHQFGGVIRPKNKNALVFRLGDRVVRARSVTIPARPYLGFGPLDEREVLDALDVLLPGGRS